MAVALALLLLPLPLAAQVETAADVPAVDPLTGRPVGPWAKRRFAELKGGLDKMGRYELLLALTSHEAIYGDTSFDFRV